MKVKVVQTYYLEIPDVGTPERLELISRYDEMCDTTNLLSDEDYADGCLPSDDSATMLLAMGEIEGTHVGNGSECIKGYAELVEVEGRIVQDIDLNKDEIIRKVLGLGEEE